MKKIYTIILAAAALLLTSANVNAQTCADIYGPGWVSLRIEILTDDYPGETTFDIKDACTGAVLASYGDLTEPNTLYFLDACVNGNFEFVIYDSFGDGLCCDYGIGSYAVIYDDVLVGSGGAFGSSESVFFGNGDPCPPPASNDNCADAASIACGDIVEGTTLFATADGAATCGTSVTAPGVWYKFTGTGEVVTVTTCGGITDFDTKLSVYSGTCDALTCVAGNDDDFSPSCSTLFSSTVSFCAQSGTDYYVLVHGFSTAIGDFTLSLTCGGELNAGFILGDAVACSGSSNMLQVVGTTGGSSLQWQDGPTGGPYTDIFGENSDTYLASAGYYVVEATCGAATATTAEFAVTSASPPSNDDICNAQPLILGALTPFDNTCATVEDGEPVPGPGSSGCSSQDGWCDVFFLGEPGLEHTVWFSFTAPASGAVSLKSTFDAVPFDTQLALWSSDSDCNGTFSLVAANDDTQFPSGFPDFSSFITPVYCLEEGRTYYVQVDGFGGGQGTGTVIVDMEENAKVIICHKRPRKSDQTIEVSICALPAHLAHGDTEGPCISGKTDGLALMEEEASSSFVQVYPNPFSDKTTIEFTTEVGSDKVTLEIYNVTGQKLATLFEGSMGEGETKQISFTPADLSTQMFVYVLKTDSKVNIGKMNMIK